MQAGLQVAGRMVKYSYYIARISSFIASNMQSSVTKNLVFPSCGDIKILQLLVCTSHVSPCVSSADVDVPRSSNAGCHAEMMCSCKDGMCWWLVECVA